MAPGARRPSGATFGPTFDFADVINTFVTVGSIPYIQRKSLVQLAFRWIFDSLKELD